jgi:hypothetical protein
LCLATHQAVGSSTILMQPSFFLRAEDLIGASMTAYLLFVAE